MDFWCVYLYVMTAVLGVSVGSFLNVVIYRLPREMSLAFPPSHCTSCNYTLRWYDNIPVFSYLFLGGKCRKCGAHISIRYTLVELANMLLWLASVALFWKTSPVYAILAALASTVGICIFFIDLEHMIIPDRFTVMTGILGAVAIFFDSSTRWWDHLIGCAAGGLTFLLIYYLAIWVFKREGMGWGDVKLAFAVGLLLGWQKFLLAMLLASVVGSVVLVCLNRLRGEDKRTEYPFGPFIIGGAVVAMLVGTPIIEWYLRLLLP